MHNPLQKIFSKENMWYECTMSDFYTKILKNAIYLLFLVVLQFKVAIKNKYIIICICIMIINQHKIVIKEMLQFLQYPFHSDM